jgi:hypothetical protein
MKSLIAFAVQQKILILIVSIRPLAKVPFARGRERGKG